jgi:replicative DNA helicase
MTPVFTSTAELFAGWRDDVLSGKPPPRFPAAESGPLAELEIAPGNVTLIGGPPGVGKTAFVMQLVTDALRLNPDLKALVCNVEMTPAALLERQLARLSGVGLTVIRRRQLTAAHRPRIDSGLTALLAVSPRLGFTGFPFALDTVAAGADRFGADLLVLDYVQRIAPPGDHKDRRGAVDATMSTIRGFAASGVAVIAVAAVGRQRDARGSSSYDGLTLASFRESSELEYGADDAFILTRDDAEDSAAVTLRHVKSRHGEQADIPLRFIGAVQRFDPAGGPAGGKLSAAVKAAWGDPTTSGAEGGDW